MLSKFSIGDVKYYKKIVGELDVAMFDDGEVHPVYSTFALGRDAEWSSRLFVLEMKEADEEGIGTFLNITHVSPALVGQEVVFEATIARLEKNNIDCNIVCKVGERIVARCQTGQKILKKERIKQLFETL